MEQNKEEIIIIGINLQAALGQRYSVFLNNSQKIEENIIEKYYYYRKLWKDT